MRKGKWKNYRKNLKEDPWTGRKKRWHMEEENNEDLSRQTEEISGTIHKSRYMIFYGNFTRMNRSRLIKKKC